MEPKENRHQPVGALNALVGIQRARLLAALGHPRSIGELDEAAASAKGAGMSVYIKVDDIADYHAAVVAQGMKPDREPELRPSGNREFALRDPDGYRLVFFQKK